MSASDRILARLEQVRQTGCDRWVACCPAHEDRSPSLSIRETADGRLLLYDFGGCQTGDVLAALGMELSDLYDKPLGHSFPPSKSRIPARDLLELVGFEIDAATIILADVADGRSISAVAWQRISTAAARIGQARVHIHGR